jgi:hypothetical protein
MKNNYPKIQEDRKKKRIPIRINKEIHMWGYQNKT